MIEITQLELRFPDAATALAVARALSNNPDVTELPPDGKMPDSGIRYDISVVNGDGVIYGPAPDETTPGERLPGYHVIGLWRGPPDTISAALAPFMLPLGTLGVAFG